MAIVVDPIYGRMKGKSGNVNFYQDRYGNQQARKNPDNSKRVASKKEKGNRVQ